MARQNRYNPNTGKRYDSNDIDIRFVAAHEAGHAVAAVVLGQALSQVSIRQQVMPDGKVVTGYTKSPYSIDRADFGKGEDVVMPHLIRLHAGPLAEERISGHDRNEQAFRDGLKYDNDESYHIANIGLCEPVIQGEQFTILAEEKNRQSGRVRELMNRTNVAAIRLVEENRLAIVAVVNALIVRKELTGDEVREIVAANPPTP